MEVHRETASVAQLEADALVVGVFSDSHLEGPVAAINQSSGGLIGRLIDQGEISGKADDVTMLWSVSGVAAPLCVVVGLGQRAAWGRGACFRAAATAAGKLAARPRDRVSFYLADALTPEVVAAGVAGAMVGCRGQDLYRAQAKRHPFAQIGWLADDGPALESGAILGRAVNLTRRLVNEPPQSIYPASFAAEAEKIAHDVGLECEIWDEKRLQDERMGALTAVGRGSSRPPRLVLLRHRGGPQNAAPLVLVGKGVTFDSGGLSIKSNDSMKTMKCDMAGAATVLGALQAIARLKLPLNVVGMMGLAENMPGSAAMKLGDVLTARNGRTIEVLNTDAEGRLVLADVLSLAVDQGAAAIVDLATLTGACLVALGTDVAGLMTSDQDWCDQVRTAADICGERCWQLPMFAEYDELIRSDVADIKNSTGIRWGGAITAAKFLAQFVGDVPWTHIDIAGPAFLDHEKPWIDGGASGCFVRTLVEIARRYTPRQDH